MLILRKQFLSFRKPLVNNEIYCIPDKLVRKVKVIYKIFQYEVLEDGEGTDWFQVTTGVKK